MRRVWLFLLECALAGLGALIGSVLGHSIGQRAVFIGALVGGVVGVLVASKLAARLGLIAREQWLRVAIGGVIGFAIAAAIAVRTLSSPIGPVLSTALIGIGAVLGAGGARERPRN